jgi:uncharacterized membrane protein YhaH (DUF805 family)
MNFGPAIASGFTKYFTFTGEARRAEFWWWTLFTAVVMLVLSLVDGALTGLRGIGILSTVWALAVLIPSLAISVRRLRDAGNTWRMLFVLLIPVIGMVVFFLVLCQPSTERRLAAHALSAE